jgi:hypothetical protein
MEKLLKWSRRESFAAIALFIASCLAPDVRAQSEANDEEPFVQLVADFGRLRTLAYSQVVDLKSINASSKSNGKSKAQMSEGEAIYKKAKLASDTWIDVARAAVASGDARPNSEALKSASEDLHKRTDELVAFVQAARASKSPKEETRNPALISAVAALIASLVDATLTVYEAWGKADEQYKTQMRVELERLRWSQFSEI